MATNLSNIVLFGGNLAELEDYTNDKYEIAGEYFQSKVYFSLDLEESCRKELKLLGFDGIIRRQDYNKYPLPFFPIKFMTGVPVKLIERGK